MIVEELILRVRSIVDQSVQQVPKKIDGIKRKAADAGAALAVMGAALGALTISSARAVRDQQRLADGLGESIATVQELSHAFEILGADENDVADALATISDRAEDAKGGMQSFIDDFALIGIAVDDLRGKSPSELFDLMVDSASRAENANKRVTAAVRIFGDDLGRKLLPLLAEGSAGLERMKKEARDLGLVIDEETKQAATDLTTDIDRLNARVGGLARGLGLRLLPAGGSVTRELGRMLDVMQPLITQGFDGLAAGVNRAAAGLETPSGRIAALIGTGIAGRGIAGQLSELADKVPVLGPMLKKLGGVLKPLGVAAVIALGFQDLWSAVQGGDSVIGRAAESIGVGSPFRDAMSGLKELLDGAASAASLFGDAVMTALRPAIPILEALADAGSQVGEMLAGGLGAFLSGAGTRFRSAARGFQLASRYAQGDQGVEVTGNAGGVTGALVSAASAQRVQSMSAPVAVTVNSGPSKEQIAIVAGQEVTRQVRVALADAGG